MKTLNREKSKELFYRIKSLGEVISMLSYAVQNPDFVNEENAKENLNIFETDCNTCISSFNQLREEVKQLYN
jgi:hypothetical protein